MLKRAEHTVLYDGQRRSEEHSIFYDLQLVANCEKTTALAEIGVSHCRDAAKVNP